LRRRRRSIESHRHRRRAGKMGYRGGARA
jgi:hypothetical protein